MQVNIRLGKEESLTLTGDAWILKRVHADRAFIEACRNLRSKFILQVLDLGLTELFTGLFTSLSDKSCFSAFHCFRFRALDCFLQTLQVVGGDQIPTNMVVESEPDSEYKIEGRWVLCGTDLEQQICLRRQRY